MVLPRAVLYRPLTARIQAWEGLVPTRSDNRSKASADPPDTQRAQIEERRLANVVSLLTTASQARQRSTVRPLSGI